MNFRSASSRPDPLIFNVISLVDVLMVLIIFLLLTWATTQSESDVDIKLPTAQSGTPRPGTSSPLIINVQSNGKFSINHKAFDDPGIQALLQQLVQLNPQQLVVLRADRQVAYEQLMKVLDFCRTAGIENIAFSTLPASSNAGSKSRSGSSSQSPSSGFPSGAAQGNSLKTP